ncbi:MAG: response regulator transcription factor [Bacteroidota bacterium]
MTNVLIVDDHPVVRVGLKRIISSESDFNVCAEAKDFNSMMEILKNKSVQIVLMDISMPGTSGYDALPIIKMAYPKLPIIMLSSLSEDIYAIQSLKAGASGFVNKESAPEELSRAIRKVMNGGIYVSESVVEKQTIKLGGNCQNVLHESLSSREFQVLVQLGSGKTIQQISHDLFLSPKTVSTYRARILEKMSFESTAEIVKYCIEANLSET